MNPRPLPRLQLIVSYSQNVNKENFKTHCHGVEKSLTEPQNEVFPLFELRLYCNLNLPQLEKVLK